MNELTQLLEQDYGLSGVHLEALVGEVNRNFRVDCDQGSFVVKVSAAGEESLALAREESELLKHLSAAHPGFFQQPIASLGGRFIREEPGSASFHRLLTYAEGQELVHVPHTRSLFSSLGALLAQMDLSLMDLQVPGIRSRRYHWDNLHFDLSMGSLECIAQAEIRRLVDYFHLQFHEQVVPRLPGMRYSTIHNDANDYNVLVQGGRVSGIIDFGDCVHSLLVNELAIALAYALLDKEDPLDWAVPVIEGYCSLLPLEEVEADLLYYLVATRLSISLLHSARARKEQPGNAYLGVSEGPAKALLKRWIAISPLKASQHFRKAAGLPLPPVPPIGEEVDRRWSVISRAYSLTYEEPIRMQASAFQYMYDDRGNSFLDLRNNIPHVGHAHPRVVRAGQRAMARLNTNTRYLYEELPRYAERLLSTFPASLDRVFFVNSGSAASDLAIRLARTHTRRQGVLVMEHGYHGNTATGIEISHYKFAGKAGAGSVPHILTVPIPLSGHGPSPEEKARANRQQLEVFLASAESRGGELAAFITEAIVSAAGQVEIAADYMQPIYDFVRRHGGVCISDEVQCGFGRLGHSFWGFEQAGVVPDAVVLGKPMGNGHPMAAVVCTRALADSFHNGMEFFSSFGGNPVSCAIGVAVLEVLEEEQLAGHAAEVGKYLAQGFEELRREFPVFGEIRGSGLSLGVELLEPDSELPATALAAHLVKGLRERQILVGCDGPQNNVFKLKPPLCFSRDNADQLFKAIREVLAAV